MIRHPEYTRARLVQMCERLQELVYPASAAPDGLLVSGPVERITHEQAQQLEFRPVARGERFGPLWSTHWFRGSATVPADWAGGRVDLVWDSASEATLWLEGFPAQGLNRHHRDAVLVERAAGGERVEFEVELACNDLFGEQHAPYELHLCELGRFDADAWRLALDFEILRALADEDGLDEAWAGELLSELNRFCNVWPEPEGAEILAALYERRNATTAHELVAVGHAHLDTAWLWPLAETYRKAIRTFTTQARYLRQYPDYRFACSQAQQYAWIEETRPELWAEIKALADAGGWVPVGGTWIEPDCNIPSGESLLRQFLHGQRYFEQRFGRRCTEFWNPDVFGYNGQLPQIMREGGVVWFLTQKLSWNRFNQPEHHTFVWQGIDGSEVLAHFPPADTYTSAGTVAELRKSARDYKDHEHSRTSMLVYGYGDGGGGPTRAMIETMLRARDLQGLPRTRMAAPAELFEALEAEPGVRPTILGELYFEYHRGTYTTQARTKRGNRRAEIALHDAEFLATVAGGDYPRQELDRLWKLLLLQQFHDILPGSSIRLVYEDAERDLAEVEAGADAIAATALAALGGGPMNTTAFERREVARTPAGELTIVEAPPYGVGVQAADELVLNQHKVTRDGLLLANEHLRAELGEDGTVLSLVDRATGREALAAPGNRLELYDDRPVAFEAWDIDPFHLETRQDCPPATSYEAVTDSPLRAEVAFERAIGEASTMRQVVRLDAGSRRLEFHTEIDWHEERTLLKTCFPLAVRAPNATYEMQFGYAQRPTHYSTSHDRARYEVPGHRFADLSEHGFGVAVLTDCKYGYSCYGNELRISLLRASKSPDPEADMGRHEFAYAVLPHAGGWRKGGVVAEAALFNQPLRQLSGDGEESVVSTQSRSYVSVDDPNLVLDTVKRAEDSDAIVLRLYEAHGARGVARVRLALPFDSANRANALEDVGDELEVDGGTIVVPYRPHEVVTVIAR